MNDDDFPAGLSAPARRALAAAGVRRLDDLAGRPEAEIAALHGMGPKAIELLRGALTGRGLSFAQGDATYNPQSSTVGSMRFRTTVELGGKTATGLQVSDEVVSTLASGKRPSVRITIGGHTYRTTVASMAGRFLVPLSADNRSAAGVAAGDDIDVEIALDTAPREVSVPDDLADALGRDEGASQLFNALPYTHRKEWVRWIEEAKQAETRSTRVHKTVDALRSGKRTR
jgi:hypothetical protein